jgi:hypothetical protein
MKTKSKVSAVSSHWGNDFSGVIGTAETRILSIISANARPYQGPRWVWLMKTTEGRKSRDTDSLERHIKNKVCGRFSNARACSFSESLVSHKRFWDYPFKSQIRSKLRYGSPNLWCKRIISKRFSWECLIKSNIVALDHCIYIICYLYGKNKNTRHNILTWAGILGHLWGPLNNLHFQDVGSLLAAFNQ